MTELLRLEHMFLNRYKLWNINATIYAGEILAVVAQSHTCRQGLLELVTGGVKPDAGKLYLRGAETQFTSRLYAKRSGIGCVRMHSQLVPNMAIYENIFINREGGYFEKLHSKKVYCRETAQLLAEAGLQDISPSAPAWSISPATRHIIEIVKATSLHAKVLFIDNITDKYTGTELDNLMMFINKLKKQGISIVFLINKYSALLSIADRVTVIRDGTTAAHINHRNVEQEELYHYMAAAPLSSNIQDRELIQSKIVLNVCDLQTEDGGPRSTFCVKEGEVFGILETDHEQGLAWGEALCGRRTFNGAVSVNGKQVTLRSPSRALRDGIAFIAENEFGNSVFNNMNLTDNITIMMDRRYDHLYGLVNRGVRTYKMKQALEQLGCEDLLKKYGTRRQLRHTNREDQMKIIFAKWLCVAPKVMVMMNPQLSFNELTMHTFADMTNILTKHGISIIIISTNMNNVAQLCDRIVSFGQV